MTQTSKITPGVGATLGKIVNYYFVGEPGQTWTLVDTGMPGAVGGIVAAATQRYGPDVHPEAIVLTHAHFDHTGAVRALADLWDVPVFLHPLEMPYVTGRSSYPPFDPTVGGFFPFLSRLFPENSPNLEGHLRELPPDGTLPTMPGWAWLPTPGHSPGHVSLFREADGTLIVGDAFITMNMNSFRDWLTRRPEIAQPPPYATCDWEAARQSARRLADLRPRLVATGHGDPLSGPDVADRLDAFADHFPVPKHGRYVPTPAHTDEQGIISLPPPVPDPVPLAALGLGGAGLAGLALARARRKQG